MASVSQVVIFGASGDLTRRKLVPALVAISAQDPHPELVIVGVSRRPQSDAAFRARLREAMPPELQPAFDRLASRIVYHAADVSAAADLRGLGSRLEGLPGGAEGGRLYYLSLKSSLFARAVAGLAEVGLIAREGPWRRVVVEKPFGRSLCTARALNAALQRHLAERQIFRIDHYLGKETVQNLLGFRFHNAIFEPLWNRHHVELVQITVAESLGMESGRAGYYDQSGAVRDMLQNHMLQVLALVAMEPPSALSADAIRGEKVDVLRGLRRPTPAEVGREVVRAQYGPGRLEDRELPGYRQAPGVTPGSTTETYVALRAHLDTWRWGGVPFLLRHGKRMPKKLTEVQVQFRAPPLQLFNRLEGDLCRLRPNVLTLSIQPREAIRLSFGVKVPGPHMVMSPATLSFDYQGHFGGSTAPAYERLLLDALQGDATLFLHGDEIEASWRFADAILEGFEGPDAPPLLEYAAGTWGPEAADGLFEGCEGSWSRG